MDLTGEHSCQIRFTRGIKLLIWLLDTKLCVSEDASGFRASEIDRSETAEHPGCDSVWR